jgi:sulfide:quinone oxidoreductase
MFGRAVLPCRDYGPREDVVDGTGAGMAHVVIAGGGFGGLAAAHELRTNHPEIDVTLVDRRDGFFMGFAKLWDLGRVRPLAEGTRPLQALTGRGVRFLQTSIESIDPAARTVVTGEGTLEADALLIALGAAKQPKHLAMLAGEGAHDLYDAAALPGMHRDLDAIEAGTVLVSILGGPFQCPPAPYEGALLVAERLREAGRADRVSVAISTPQPIALPAAGVDASRYIAEQLGDYGVDLLAGRAVESVDGAGKVVHFADGSTAAYDLLLGVPASVAPPLVADAGLAGGSGFIEPDRHTLQTSFDRVYAVGDCTHIPNANGALPKAGVFAAGEGVVAAQNMAADLTGSDRASFDGHGMCFLELPDRKVAFVEGDFYADPPEVTLSDADEEHFRRKVAYETDRLDLWLG